VPLWGAKKRDPGYHEKDGATVNCPGCSTEIGWRRVFRSKFECPGCHASLRVVPWRLRVISIPALLLNFLMLFGLMRDVNKWLGKVAVSVIYLSLIFVLWRLFYRLEVTPPDFLSIEPRGGWYPGGERNQVRQAGLPRKVVDSEAEGTR
jgi:hypothetical protein